MKATKISAIATFFLQKKKNKKKRRERKRVEKKEKKKNENPANLLSRYEYGPWINKAALREKRGVGICVQSQCTYYTVQ